MTFKLLKNYFDSKNEKNHCLPQDNYKENVTNTFSFQTYSSHQLFNYVMNLNRSSPLSNSLKRSPSNLSEISQLSISNQAKSQGLYTDYKIGDYVYVDSISGVKYGIIRYAGYTDFAPGYWFGIELNEPNGKNNGTIRGKSYFTCPDLHGIFTQASKISKSSPIKKSRKLSSSGSNFGSKESINSTCFLKKSNLNTSQESLRSCVSGVSEITGVFKAPNSERKKYLLQKALNEKEKYENKIEINNLSKDLSVLKMKEESENNELTILKKQVDEKFKQNNEEFTELKRTINEEKKLNKELLNQLDEEKKKSEVLEFRLEEEIVNRMQLDEEMKKKNELIDILNKKNLNFDNLKEDENEMEMFQLQEDIIKKEEKLMQLESSLKTKQLENSNLLERIREFEQTLKVFEQRQENYLVKIDELNLTVKKYEQKNGQLEEFLLDKNELIASQSKNSNDSESKDKEIKELNQKLNSKNEENFTLNKKLNNLNIQLQDSLNEQQNLTNKLNQIQIELSNKIKLIDSKEQEYQQNLEKNLDSHKQTEQQLINRIDKTNQLLCENQKKTSECEQVIQVLKKDFNLKEERLNCIEKELLAKNEQIERLTGENVELKSICEQKLIDLNNLNSKLDYYYGNLERSKTEKQKLEVELDNLQNLVDEREESLHNFVKKKLQFQNEMQGLIREINVEKERNEKLMKKESELIAEHEKNMSNVLCELNESRKLCEQVNFEFEAKSKLADKLDNECYILRNELSSLKQDHIKLEEEFNSITLMKQDQQNDLNALNKKYIKKLDKLNQELLLALNENKCLSDNLIEKDIEINGLHVNHQQQINQIQQQSFLECVELENKIKNLEQELSYQQKQLFEEKSLNIEKSKKLSEIVEEEQLNNEDKDLYESQIKFLNEVIVDMQKKNDELNNKMKILEEIRQEEMNIYKVQTDDLSNNIQDNQFSFKKVSSKMNAKEKQLSFNSPQRTVRLFCSFCGKFDLHDTEDCKFKESKLDEQNHSKNGLARKISRPYCVYCGTFEHWSHDCM